jgi:RNA polymerase sigma-70 factor (ECF subfamily)
MPPNATKMTVAVGARAVGAALALTFFEGSEVHPSPPRRGSDDPFESRAIAAVRRGDSSAYEYLVTKHGRRVLSIALSLVRNVADAEDLAQEAFLRAFENIGKFRTEQPFGPWIHRIVANLALDWLKSRKRRPVLESTNEPETPSPEDPGRDLSMRELVSRIDGAMESLPPMQQMIARLYLVEEFEYAEIAEMTGLGESTVRSHLSHARARLQTVLRDARIP